jgi:hypothetical protein
MAPSLVLALFLAVQDKPPEKCTLSGGTDNRFFVVGQTAVLYFSFSET